jgi:hypothetical protein
VVLGELTEGWYYPQVFLAQHSPSGRVWGNVARLWAERKSQTHDVQAGNQIG